jgi:hypothetical protein
MIGVTISGLLFTPIFYVACRSLALWLVDVLRPAVGRRWPEVHSGFWSLRSDSCVRPDAISHFDCSGRVR